MGCGNPAVIGRRVVMLALTLAAICVSDRVVAADWTEREFASFRLLPNTTALDGASEVLIGLEIDLAPGWHFYSKDPGEYGVAPEFDWTASQNLAQAVVYWPEPTRIVYSTDPPVSVLAYKGPLLLPVVLEPESPDEDFDVRLVLEYAVCSDYCVVDTVGLGLTLPAVEGKPTLQAARLQRALTDAKAVPQ